MFLEKLANLSGILHYLECLIRQWKPKFVGQDRTKWVPSKQAD